MTPAPRRPKTTTSQDLYAGFGEAWAALSTLIAGIAVWGGIGYLVDRLLGTWPGFFAGGVILGNFAGIYLVYLKYFRETGDAKEVYRRAA